jgi:hypothetical protein
MMIARFEQWAHSLSRRFDLLLFALCLLAVLWSPSTTMAAGTAPSAGQVILQPSDQAGNQIPGPGYFQITAAPGSSTQLYAIVGNVGKTRFTVSIVPVDARSGVYGGVSYNLPQQKRKRVGAWIALSTSRVVVHPGRASVVAFTVRVPASTAPGQYVGGLTAFVPAPRSGPPSGPHQRSGAIILQLRRIVAVVVTIPGPAYGRFAVSRVNPKQRPDAVYLIAHIRNTGTILLKGQGTLWMWKQGRKSPVLTKKLLLDTTVPQTTVLYPILWARHPANGVYHVTIQVSWDGGHTTRKFTFTRSTKK